MELVRERARGRARDVDSLILLVRDGGTSDGFWTPTSSWCWSLRTEMADGCTRVTCQSQGSGSPRGESSRCGRQSE